MNWTTVMECGCEIKTDYKQDKTLIYCPKHKAAPEMYETLKELAEFDAMGGNGKDHYILIRQAKEALAKAEGG